MFNSEKSEKLLAESIAEFSAPVRNDSSWATISSEHQVEFLCNSWCLFVGDGDHFCPFAEVILDAENVLVPSAFTHLHQIYGNLIPHFLRNRYTFQLWMGFLNTDGFPTLTSVATLDIIFHILHDTSPITLPCNNFSSATHSKKYWRLHWGFLQTRRNWQ